LRNDRDDDADDADDDDDDAVTPLCDRMIIVLIDAIRMSLMSVFIDTDYR